MMIIISGQQQLICFQLWLKDPDDSFRPEPGPGLTANGLSLLDKLQVSVSRPIKGKRHNEYYKCGQVWHNFHTLWQRSWCCIQIYPWKVIDKLSCVKNKCHIEDFYKLQKLQCAETVCLQAHHHEQLISHYTQCTNSEDVSGTALAWSPEAPLLFFSLIILSEDHPLKLIFASVKHDSMVSSPHGSVTTWGPKEHVIPSLTSRPPFSSPALIMLKAWCMMCVRCFYYSKMCFVMKVKCPGKVAAAVLMVRWWGANLVL